VGSVCDTLGLGELELNHDFHYSISPNPNNGVFKLSYLLPQNKKGVLEIFNINGQRVYEMALPQWSKMQMVSLPENISYGIYNCVITSGNSRVSKKLVVVRE